LILFTKPAIPGRVKTRLIGRLSAEQAAALHLALLSDALARLGAGAYQRRVAWALDGGARAPQLPAGWHAVHQVGDDLGARLHAALADAGRSHRLVAAVGSDHPELAAWTVEEAFLRLEAGADGVLGPAADGGYYLVALRREALDPALFRGIAWSTPAVLPATLERARALGLRLEQLTLGHDLDDAEGLARLVRRLRAGEVRAPMPHTRALLARWDLVPATAAWPAEVA